MKAEGRSLIQIFLVLRTKKKINRIYFYRIKAAFILEAFDFHAVTSEYNFK